MHVLGIDASGAARSMPHGGGGWTLHPNPRPVDVFAELALAELVPALRPRSVLLCHDAWFVPRMRRAIGGGPAVAAYCPIDGALLRPDIVGGLTAVDAVAVPSDFSRRQVLTAAADLGLADRPPFRGIAVVPHGVDRAAFGPRGGTPDDVGPRRLGARRALFPERPELWRGFWVLNASRNQARKRLDLTLRGFALFASGAGPDVRLHVHWGADGPGVDVSSVPDTALLPSAS